MLPVHVPHSNAVLASGKDRDVMTLRVRFSYEPDLAGGSRGQYASEMSPVLHVFATHGLGVMQHDGPDDGVVVVSATHIDAQQAGQRHLIVNVPFNPAAAQYGKLQADALWALPGAAARTTYALPDGRGVWPVPADASISFNAYAETATQHGQACRTRAGESLFLVSELVGQALNNDDIKAAWQVTGDEPLVKGFVAVHGAELVHWPAGTVDEPTGGQVVRPDDHVRFVDDGPTAAVFHGTDADAGAAQRAVVTATRLAERVNASLDVFFPAETAPLGRVSPPYLQRMHCPYYNTTAGMLWGSTYALRVPRAKPNAAYFRAALTAALVRADADPAHLLAVAQAQSSHADRMLPGMHALLGTMSTMLTVYANAMVYLDDFTNSGGNTYIAAPDPAKSSHVRLFRRNAAREGEHSDTPAVNTVEDYKIARLGHGDDCEGVAKETYVQFWQFRRAEFPAATDAAGALLHALQAVARSNAYTPMLVLAGVTNKKLDVGVRDMAPDAAMAHTYTAFVPTARVLDRLADDVPGMAGAAHSIRTSQYATAYVREPWHAGLPVLIAEGTARSNPLVMPATWYAPADARARIRAQAQRRLAAQIALMQALPMDAVSVEIPNQRIDDVNDDITADRADASDFYKGNSAAYVSAFRDTGILDFAFARQEEGSTLTHGLRFSQFVAPAQWHDAVRIVPYNRLTPEDGGIADATLAQLEPIPVLRRSAAAAARVSVPAALRAVETLFSSDTVAGLATAPLAEDPVAGYANEPGSIVVTMRAEDVTPGRAAQVVAAVQRSRTLFTGARVHAHYLSDPPVPGDETSLPPVVLYDIELRLRTDV